MTLSPRSNRMQAVTVPQANPARFKTPTTPLRAPPLYEDWRCQVSGTQSRRLHYAATALQCINSMMIDANRGYFYGKSTQNHYLDG